MTMSDFEKDVIAQLAEIKQKFIHLDEKLSDIKSLEVRITEIEKWKNEEAGKSSYRSGIFAAIGAIFGGAGVSLIMWLISCL